LDKVDLRAPVLFVGEDNHARSVLLDEPCTSLRTILRVSNWGLPGMDLLG